jgi:hypothetical protein
LEAEVVSACPLGLEKQHKREFASIFLRHYDDSEVYMEKPRTKIPMIILRKDIKVGDLPVLDIDLQMCSD